MPHDEQPSSGGLHSSGGVRRKPLHWQDRSAAAAAALKSLEPGEATRTRASAFRHPANRLTRSVLSALAGGARVPMADAATEADPIKLTILLLQTAAEVEHALMAEYLYGFFGLDTDSDFGSQSGATLLDIAVEEMGHLMTVQNLLLSLGGAPHFNLQAESPTEEEQEIYPFPLHMRPFTKAAVATYVTTEAPVPLPPVSGGFSAEDKAAAENALAEADGDVPGGVIHVGMLYARLLWIFQEGSGSGGPPDFTMDMTSHLGDVHLPVGTVFQTAAQESSAAWPGRAGFFIETVATRDDAKRVLQRIADQGEGWDSSDHPAPSHFQRFLGIYRSYPAPGVPVVLSLAENPRLPGDPSWPGTASSAQLTGVAIAIGKFFRLRYEILVRLLSLLLFSPQGSPLRNRLRQDALIAMARTIPTFARSLVARQLGPPFRLLKAPPTTAETLKAELSAAFTAALDLIAQLPEGNLRSVAQALIPSDTSLQALF